MKLPHAGVRRAFTLIEMLLVLVILGILASIAVPIYLNRTKDSREDATRIEIASLSTALKTFEVDNGRFPSTNEGLDALIQPPPDLEATWHGPYVEIVPTDKWNHEYHYKSPADNDGKLFQLYSNGPDGLDGTSDDVYRFKPASK